MEPAYFVYILRCADGTYYTGIARDVSARVREHNESTRGAKYTKARRPVALVYTESAADRSSAQKREYAVRHLTRPQKIVLIQKESTKSSSLVLKRATV
jgi:putative endonuclease